jgi:hypothetical protein
MVFYFLTILIKKNTDTLLDSAFCYVLVMPFISVKAIQVGKVQVS